MTAQELLPILQRMLEDYEKVDPANVPVDFQAGFCNYIYSKAFPSKDYVKILEALFEDYIPSKHCWKVYKMDYLEQYWYPVYDDEVNGYKESIQPRIDNLKRTIQRLESTLN